MPPHPSPPRPSSSPLPSAFHDLPASAFPFTVELVAERTGEVVWKRTVTGPGALAIPGLAEEHGPIMSRVTFADGTSAEMPSESARR